MIVALLVSPALAVKGGVPAAHGVDGKEFGPLVKELATSEPGAVADHIKEYACVPGGMPAAHEVDGKTFGCLVKALATSEPGAVAEHVRGC